MNYVAYLRVSTDKQGASGLGLDAQKSAIKNFIKPDDQLVDYFIEIESGKTSDRPELMKAMAACRLKGATLLVAKLDRLSRNLAFIATLMESQTKFIACDMPDADPLRLHIEAAVAEDERRRISKRTVEALKAARERGVKLGGHREGSGYHRPEARARAMETKAKSRREFIDRVRPIIVGLRAEGITSRIGLAEELNRRGVRTQQGGYWFPETVRRVLEYLHDETTHDAR
jgi:DNA invertase Pin-like site-specific DNA recombinase